MTAPLHSPAPVRAAHPAADAPAGDTAPPDAFAALLAGVVAPAVLAAPAARPGEAGTTVPDTTPGTTGPRTPVLDAPPGWPPTGLPKALVPALPAVPTGPVPTGTAPAGPAVTPPTVTTTTGPTVTAPAVPPAAPVATAVAATVPTLTPTTTAAPVPGDEQVVRTAPVHAEHGRPPQPGHTRLRPREIDAPVRTADGPVPTAITPAAPVTSTEPVGPASPAAAAVESGATRHVRPAIVEAARHLRAEGGRTSLVVRLDPPELGAVLVRLTVKDGQVDVQLRTPDLTARGDLQAQSFDVQQVLRESGLDLSSFDVAHGDVLGAPAGDPRGGQPDGGRQTPDRATPRPSWDADGPATTAVVMDDAPSPQPAGTWL